MASYNLVQYVFDRELMSVGEDVAVMTCHIREVVQGAPDLLPVTDQGRQDFVTNSTAWWQGIRPHLSSKLLFREIRFYDVPASPGQDMGPPVLVTPFNDPGTSTGNLMPPQLAISVTLRTDKRATWGRMYIPGLTAPCIDPAGRVSLQVATDFAQAWKFITTRAGTGAALTVFSRKEWTHHDPQLIQIDDVVDVMRSRRYRTTLHREQVSAG